MFLSKLVITNALMLILFLSMYESEGASNSSGSLSVVNGANINPPLAHQTVNVSVYYDSLCQSCAQFIIRDLKNVFDSNLISIMNLRLVPWAKAYINKTNSSISCQVQFYLCFAAMKYHRLKSQKFEKKISVFLFQLMMRRKQRYMHLSIYGNIK